MREEASEAPAGSAAAAPVGAAWHAAAGLTLLGAAAWNAGAWLTAERMPGGDFAGYAAQVQAVRDAVLAHGRVPRWCVECYGGTTNFTSHAKEWLALPLAWALEPVLATKLLTLLLRIASGLGIYALAARELRAPAVGIVAGVAYAFGAFANHQLEHLDIAFAAALVPPIFGASLALLRRGGAALALLLGALVALQFVNHWVHALTAPLSVGLVVLWRPWPGGRLAPGWGRGVALAFAGFLALAASQLAWVAADAENHQLTPPETIAAQRAIYVERSPFLFVNRDDVLGPWLAEHSPPGFDLARWDGGRRYLGLVVLLVCVAGSLAGRRDSALRRWAPLCATGFALHYWLALGPRTLLWEVAESFGVSAATQAILARGLLLAAGVGALVALARAWRGRLWRRDSPGAERAAAARWLAAALLCAFPVVSLWNLAARALPFFALQRSPGHFMDVATFWLYWLFAVATLALVRRVARPRLALAGVAALGALVVADFAPSRRVFEAGAPLAPLRTAATTLRSLEGEGGTLRIGQPLFYAPLTSWLTAQGSAGAGFGWLPWRAGPQWVDLLRGATYAESRPGPDGRLRVLPDDALRRLLRLRYFLLRRGAELPPPWRRVEAGPDFDVWEQPEVAPYAALYRESWWLLGEPAGDGPELVRRALERNAVVVTAAPLAEAEALRSAARRTLLAPSWRLALRGAARPGPAARPLEPPRRDHPERIRLAVDAGAEPGWLVLSESHHPWWRARVDGSPAPLLRAQLTLMAVPLGPGSHEVEIDFVRPAGVAVADALSLGSAIALAVAGGFGLLRRLSRRSGSPPRPR